MLQVELEWFLQYALPGLRAGLDCDKILQILERDPDAVKDDQWAMFSAYPMFAAEEGENDAFKPLILARRDGTKLAVHPDDDAYQKAQNNLLNKFFAEPDTRIKVMHINDFLINSSSGLDPRVEAAMTGLQQSASGSGAHGSDILVSDGEDDYGVQTTPKAKDKGKAKGQG
ncbi:hypothetical protein ONZ51_g5940 [Trametes cubensis]|uniref:Uncharacterized protein n=1 Tax=Trametes cubensis TaxID=1111947 RepID=A0AAD7TVM7_9APHY|nr:hypothetical protein ONZ51_g5940 [Trametes cubensis]